MKFHIEGTNKLILKVDVNKVEVFCSLLTLLNNMSKENKPQSNDDKNQKTKYFLSQKTNQRKLKKEATNPII